MFLTVDELISDLRIRVRAFNEEEIADEVLRHWIELSYYYVLKLLFPHLKDYADTLYIKTTKNKIAFLNSDKLEIITPNSTNFYKDSIALFYDENILPNTVEIKVQYTDDDGAGNITDYTIYFHDDGNGNFNETEPTTNSSISGTIDYSKGDYEFSLNLTGTNITVNSISMSYDTDFVFLNEFNKSENIQDVVDLYSIIVDNRNAKYLELRDYENIMSNSLLAPNVLNIYYTKYNKKVKIYPASENEREIKINALCAYDISKEINIPTTYRDLIIYYAEALVRLSLKQDPGVPLALFDRTYKLITQGEVISEVYEEKSNEVENSNR